MHSFIPTILIFSGVVISASAGLWASFKKDIKRKYLPPVLIFIGTIMCAGGLLWNTIIEAKKTENILAMNRNTVAVLTGENSSAFFYYWIESDDGDTITLYLCNLLGKYPLYDVSVNINDLELLDDVRYEETDVGKIPRVSDLSKYIEARTIEFIGTLSPRQVIPIKMPIRNRNKLRYEITITARNGIFNQSLILIRKEPPAWGFKWKGATKVIKDGVEPIYERIDPKFPKAELEGIK